MKGKCHLKGIFDSHSHYDDEAFDVDRQEILDYLLLDEKSPVEAIMHASTDEKSALYGIEMSRKYKNYYTSAGFHPECMDKLPQNYMDILGRLVVENPEIKAIGEIGLDYHYDGYDREGQIKLLADQLEFANEVGLPVILHCRDALQDFLELLKKYRPKGVVHCFSGSAETANEIISLDMYIGFTGVLTFKNAKKAKKALAVVPNDRLLLETDCPYMAPEPFRGKRCVSDMIEKIAECAGEIKGLSAQQIIDMTNNNARRLFGI